MKKKVVETRMETLQRKTLVILTLLMLMTRRKNANLEQLQKTTMKTLAKRLTNQRKTCKTISH